MPEETAKPITINQAFESAKAEIDKPADAIEKTVEKVEGDTKGQENKETQPELTDKAADQVETPADENDLLSFEERSKLNASEKKTHDKMMKAYTQKTQALAKQRKEVDQIKEKYSKYTDMIEAYEENPVETLKQLAKLHDLPLGQETNPDKSTVAVADQTSKMEQQLVTLLGAENTELAKGLSQIFEGNMRELAATIAKTEIEPIKNQQMEITNKTLAEAAESTMKAFESRHKDWKQFESKILELGKTLQLAPGSNMSPGAYLDMLYDLATRERSKADTTTEVVERLKRSVLSAEEPSQGVKETIVTPTAPKNASILQALEAAKKGVRWERA